MTSNLPSAEPPLRQELMAALVDEGETALAEHLRWTHQMEPESPTPAASE